MRQMELPYLFLNLVVTSEESELTAAAALDENAALEVGKETLTRRRRQVLALYLLGQTRKEIARYLGVSPNTVRNHIRLVYEQFGFKNRVEALRWALDQPALAYQLLSHTISADQPERIVPDQRASRTPTSIEGLIAEAISYYQQAVIESPLEPI